MNTEHLRVFEAAVRKGSITAAAGELGMSTPWAKSCLDTLEADTGLTLLKRTNRGVTPTEQGNIFLIRVRKVLAELSEGIDAAKQLSPAIHRVCAVEVRNAQYHIPYDCYAGALAELRSSHPEIEVDSTRVAAMPAPERHCIYIGAMELSEMEGLDERRVHSVGMVAVFAAEHPLEQMDEISLDDLHGYPLLLMDRRHMPFVEPPMGPFLGTHHFEVDHLQAEEDDGKILASCLGRGMVALMAGMPPSLEGPLVSRPIRGLTYSVRSYARPDATPDVQVYRTVMRAAFMKRFGDG